MVPGDLWFQSLLDAQHVVATVMHRGDAQIRPLPQTQNIKLLMRKQKRNLAKNAAALVTGQRIMALLFNVEQMN